jgi:hypothetical protein
MASLLAQCKLLACGALVVTFTKCFDCDEFLIINKQQMRMSWGLATVYTQIRR